MYMSECPICGEQIEGQYFGSGSASRKCHHGHYEGSSTFNSSSAVIDGELFEFGGPNDVETRQRRDKAVEEAKARWFKKQMRNQYAI